MNATTRLNFDDALLDSLSEGVILLNRQAQVLSHNRGAEPWLKQCRAMGGILKDLLDQEVRGRVKLPVKLGLWRSSMDAKELTAEVWLIMNGRRDYAIFVVPQTDRESVKPEFSQRPATQASDNTFLRLMNEEARSQLAALRFLLTPQSGDTLRNTAAITAQCQRVDALLQTLSDLSLLQNRDSVFADERLNLVDIVQTAIAVTSDTLRTGFVFNLSGKAAGIVYGNAAWLSYALRVLFESLQDSAPALSHVTIGMRQLGDFMVISGQVAPGVAPTNAKTAQAAALASAPKQTHADRDAQVRWIMCRRIIALHAGQLKFTQLPIEASDDPSNALIESFTLTLTTGLPGNERSRASCSTCRHVLQEQIYAADLAALLTRQ